MATEDDIDPIGCGHRPYWLTSPDDVFFPACAIHDKEYEMQLKPRRVVDADFLRYMLTIAGRSLFLRSKAYLYFQLARAFGGALWRKRIKQKQENRNDENETR